MLCYNLRMDNIKDLVKKITAKDEKAALPIIKNMIDDSNVQLFQELVGSSDYLFPFVKDNVCKRLEMSICKANYLNLLNFFDCYSPDYDRVFASAFKIFGDDEIRVKMLDLLKKGSISQKTYSARYFELTKDIFAIRELIDNAFSDNEYLADACAAALGSLNEQKSYEVALGKLNSVDDFEVLSALNFFISYSKNPPMTEIFSALKKSGMPENFAGKIVYLSPLPTLINEDLSNALFVIDNILSGFGEILPLSEVFNYDLYEVLVSLMNINNAEYLSRISVILLRAKSKINQICQNDEYTFDEDKNTKNELLEIKAMLDSYGDNYWLMLQNNVFNELSKDKYRILSALDIIKDFSIANAIPHILDMIYESDDETITCEGFSTLKVLNALNYISKDDALSMFTNSNLKAIVNSYYL